MKIACVSSGSNRALAALGELEERYELVDPDFCDVLVALGGDGFLLHTMRDHRDRGVPIFGMNCGTVGFLLTPTGPTRSRSGWPRRPGRTCHRSPCGPKRSPASRWMASPSTR